MLEVLKLLVLTGVPLVLAVNGRLGTKRRVTTLALFAFIFVTMNLSLSALYRLSPPLAAGLTALESLKFLALTLPVLLLARRDPRLYLLLPASWTGTEWLLERGELWGSAANGATRVGYLFFDTPLAYTARVSGVSAASFAVVTLSVAVFYLTARRFTLALTALTAVAALVAAGARDEERSSVATPTVTVAALQTALDVHTDPALARSRWARAALLRRFGALSARTEAVAPDLVIYPETAFPWFAAGRDTDDQLQKILERHDAALVGARHASDEAGRDHNSVLLWDRSSGRARRVYDKRTLVPFFERDFKPGTLDARITLRDQPVAVAICWENTFSELARRRAQDGATAIFYLTNDLFAMGTPTARLHANISRMRALETGVPVVHAALGGPTSIFDENGRLLATVPEGVDGVAVAKIALEPGTTAYVSSGDWIGALSIAAAVTSIGLVVASRVFRSRPTRAAPPRGSSMRSS